MLRVLAPAEEERAEGVVEVFDPIRPPKRQVHDLRRLLHVGQSLGVEQGEQVLCQQRHLGAVAEGRSERDLSARGGQEAWGERRERRKKAGVLACRSSGRRRRRPRRWLSEAPEVPGRDEVDEALRAVLPAGFAQPQILARASRIRVDDPGSGVPAVGAGEAREVPAPAVGGHVGPSVGRIGSAPLGSVWGFPFALGEPGAPALGTGSGAGAAVLPGRVGAPETGLGTATRPRSGYFPHVLTG
jgi:hypothetical protein